MVRPENQRKNQSTSDESGDWIQNKQKDELVYEISAMKKWAKRLDRRRDSHQRVIR